MDISDNITKIVEDISDDDDVIKQIYDICGKKIQNNIIKKINMFVKKIINKDIVRLFNGNEEKKEIYDNIVFTHYMKLNCFKKRFMFMSIYKDKDGSFSHHVNLNLYEDNIVNYTIDDKKHSNAACCKICDVFGYISMVLNGKYEIFDVKL